MEFENSKELKTHNCKEKDNDCLSNNNQCGNEILAQERTCDSKKGALNIFYAIYRDIFISGRPCRIYHGQVRRQLTRLKVCHLRQGRSYPQKCSIMQARVVKRPYSRLAIKPSIVRVLIIRAGLMMPIKTSYDRSPPSGISSYRLSLFVPLCFLVSWHAHTLTHTHTHISFFLAYSLPRI